VENNINIGSIVGVMMVVLVMSSMSQMFTSTTEEEDISPLSGQILYAEYEFV